MMSFRHTNFQCMKKIFSIVAVIAITAVAATAQNNYKAVYLSYNQFVVDKPEFVENEDVKIKLNELFDRPFITVNRNGQKSKLFKDEVFAYKSSKGDVIRLWNIVPYHLLEEGTIWIYYRDILASGKGIQKEKKYYYSAGGNDKIIPLNKWNLKSSFPDKNLFQNFLDAQFKSDAELSLYNSYAKQFQVNHLLKTTIVN